MTVVARHVVLRRVPVLVLTVAVATTVRVVAGQPIPAASPPAALLFSAVLVSAAAAYRADLVPPRWPGVALGVCGGAALVAVSLAGLPAITLGARATSQSLLWWVPLVSLVALSEELVLRGVLFSALRADHGDAVAVLLTAALFAVIHLPLYGVGAMPTDLCVGVFLGSLRVVSGGVSAPAVAHMVADLATGWVG
ncbi:MAG: CPBP family intramembrane glutamic endopeptidase [Candidatus Dormibacter sp.]